MPREPEASATTDRSETLHPITSGDDAAIDATPILRKLSGDPPPASEHAVLRAQAEPADVAQLAAGAIEHVERMEAARTSTRRILFHRSAGRSCFQAWPEGALFEERFHRATSEGRGSEGSGER